MHKYIHVYYVLIFLIYVNQEYMTLAYVFVIRNCRIFVMELVYTYIIGLKHTTGFFLHWVCFSPYSHSCVLFARRESCSIQGVISTVPRWVIRIAVTYLFCSLLNPEWNKEFISFPMIFIFFNFFSGVAFWYCWFCPKVSSGVSRDRKCLLVGSVNRLLIFSIIFPGVRNNYRKPRKKQLKFTVNGYYTKSILVI